MFSTAAYYARAMWMFIFVFDKSGIFCFLRPPHPTPICPLLLPARCTILRAWQRTTELRPPRRTAARIRSMRNMCAASANAARPSRSLTHWRWRTGSRRWGGVLSRRAVCCCRNGRARRLSCRRRGLSCRELPYPTLNVCSYYLWLRLDFRPFIRFIISELFNTVKLWT